MIFQVTLNLEHFEPNIMLGDNADGESERELSLEIV